VIALSSPRADQDLQDTGELSDDIVWAMTTLLEQAGWVDGHLMEAVPETWVPRIVPLSQEVRPEADGYRLEPSIQ